VSANENIFDRFSLTIARWLASSSPTTEIYTI